MSSATRHRAELCRSRTLAEILPVSGIHHELTVELVPVKPWESRQMSSRSLGGGRILGSGRSLSSAVSPFPPRNTSLLSPSVSTLSVNSSASTSQKSGDAPDLSSRISLEPNDDNTAAASVAASRLVCPICNEEMVGFLESHFLQQFPADVGKVTLLQLNR
jgi:hypothetical protein